jgi:Family of unknown function (DUF5681)
MPEIVAAPPSPCCYHLFPGDGIQEYQRRSPDPCLRRTRDGRGRFAKGSSGNPRGRPPGIRNPRRRVPDLAARPLSAQALSDLLDRKPHLLRPLAAQLLPPPAAVDPAERLGIDLASLRTVEDCRQTLATVLEAVARGGIAPVEGARIAKRVGAWLRTVFRLARLARRLRGPPQIAFRPDERERPNQMVDVRLAVQWRGRQAQPLGAARYGRVVDRLHIDAVPMQQLVAGDLAQPGITDHHWDNVARRRHHRQAGRGEAPLQGRRALLVALAFSLARLQMTDAGERAGGECRWQ